MLKKLRRKFIAIIMLLVGVLLSAILCSICFFLFYSLKSSMNTSLKDAVDYVQSYEENTFAGNSVSGAQNGKKAGTSSNAKIKPSDIKRQEIGVSFTSICVIRLNAKTDEIAVKLDNLKLTDNVLKSAAKIVAQTKQTQGSISEYNLYYYSTRYENGMLIAFAEKSYVTSSLKEYGIMLLLMEGCAMIVILLISLFVSDYAIRPISKAMDEQKRFIADASHELKTPLAVVMANNGILRSHKEKSIYEQIAWLDSTDEAVRHMSNLIGDMLILAKSESGLQEKQFVPVDFSTIVMRCILQFEAFAYERGISIQETVHKGIHVLGNEMQLKQLIMALIDNAVKYEADGGIIAVTLNRNRDNTELYINNSNNVIQPEALTHIFERFYKIENNDKDYNSYGLGLSIAKSIVEGHGGSISVKSNSLEGTTFKVLIRAISAEK